MNNLQKRKKGNKNKKLKTYTCRCIKTSEIVIITFLLFAVTVSSTLIITNNSIRLENSSTLTNITIYERNGCLATKHFTTLGENDESGYLKIAKGTLPTHNETGFLIIWTNETKLYVMNETGNSTQLNLWNQNASSIYYDGGNIGIGTNSPSELIQIEGNNAGLRLQDDSGNWAKIKVGNSQLTLEADPDNEIISTDIVFKMDGNEVARFQQGGDFESLDSVIAKEGFATQLWDIVGGDFEIATTGVEYYSPNQHGGFYGIVYRQYFTTSLPSSLTSGNSVSDIIDYTIIADNGNNRHTMCGWSTDGTNEVNIGLLGTSGNGNCYLTSAGNFNGNVQKGWIDYTK